MKKCWHIHVTLHISLT